VDRVRTPGPDLREKTISRTVQSALPWVERVRTPREDDCGVDKVAVKTPKQTVGMVHVVREVTLEEARALRAGTQGSSRTR